MRAKFINEIKQDIQSSGLGAIEIGKEGMNTAYRNVIRLAPHLKPWKSMDVTIQNTSSLTPLKTLIPKLLDTPEINILMAGSRSITDEAENYLHSNIFNPNLKDPNDKIEIDLLWKDTDRYIKVTIYTNFAKGSCMAEYTTPEDRFVVYYFFRKK
jgi:hypothetical protein